MSRVWIIKTGEYSQRYVFGVASSLAAAVAAIKRVYGPPYIVDWDESEVESEGQLIGKFDRVLNYSTDHVALFDIDEAEVWDA